MDTSTFSNASGLSAEELELLAYLLEEEGVEIAAQQTIFPRKQHSDLPLSFAQSRLWFLDQLDPGLTAYNIPFAMQMKGRLDIAALESSLNEVVRRHEVLRTTFPAVDGQPTQAIAPALTVNMPLLDLQALPEAEREAETYRLARREAQHTFDLARGPLIVAKLLRLAEDEHVLLLTIHHIVFDGWSLGVFLQEVIALYDVFSSGDHDGADESSSSLSLLPPLPIQYADFALWQRQWLQGELLNQQLAYWRRQLSGRRDGRSGPPILELPTDRPRPPRQTHRGAHIYRTIPLTLAETLTGLSQREGATLFMTLLAAFNVLLYRYSNQDDIVVGSPIANRDFVEIEQLVGFFVNTLLLRTDLSGDPSFRELLARVRETTLEAYAHQNIPFEQLADELQPERNLSHNPLFQVMFILQNAPLPTYQREELHMSPLQIESGAAMFDLMLALTQTPTALNVILEYNTDLFEAATMERLLDHYQVLLSGIAASPDQPLSQLPLLTEPERRQLLVAWNQTECAYPRELCAHQLFEAQAARTAEATAVVFEGQSLSYGELNARANRLAQYLRRLGVGPETLVGLCLERSLELIVGVLGVLKAGGAYLPLDPNYPSERLAYMLEDSGARVLLTATSDERRPTAEGGRSIVDELRAVVGGQWSVVDLVAEGQAIGRERAENPSSEVGVDNLAYVIYTSGSVGQPKGVLIPHRALVNYTAVAGERFAIGAADRVLQFASISFDTAAEEIYPCLARGATLVLRTEALLSAAPMFLQACRDLGLTVLDLPTAYWHQLTAEIAAEGLSLPESLRLVIIGGEPALPDRMTMWQHAVGNRVRLINTYGPTEATIVATSWELPAERGAAELATVPIGRPIDNAQVYVLDRHGNPVPIGVPGELYIGGVGVARGYLGRPELTAEKFVPSPWSVVRGPSSEANDNGQLTTDNRLYKTGDLVRYRVDGTLEFLGRTDHQVKIRGFRVEPGEIEAVLQRHPSIREIAVVARDAAPGDTRLVAYVVPTMEARDRTDAAPDGTADGEQWATLGVALRQWALERLPDYMIPSALEVLDALPMMPTGKVDRQALPAPDWSRRPLDQTYVAPRTPLEAAVADLAAGVLGVARVGVHDNFFALGGHSLLATQLVARLRETFGIDLPLRSLFEAPTIAALAERIETIQWVIQGEQAPAGPADEDHEEGEI